jgi:predicted transcriptional regulator
MVDFTVRLPRQVATRLHQCADEWNVPVQALVVQALQASLAQDPPAD